MNKRCGIGRSLWPVEYLFRNNQTHDRRNSPVMCHQWHKVLNDNIIIYSLHRGGNTKIKFACSEKKKKKKSFWLNNNYYSWLLLALYKTNVDFGFQRKCIAMLVVQSLQFTKAGSTFWCFHLLLILILTCIFTLQYFSIAQPIAGP